MKAMVPLALHSEVSTPMSTKVTTTVPADRTLPAARLAIARSEHRRTSPYPMNSSTPTNSAGIIDQPRATLANSTAQNSNIAPASSMRPSPLPATTSSQISSHDPRLQTSMLFARAMTQDNPRSYDERMVLVIAQSLWLDLVTTGTANSQTNIANDSAIPNTIPDERAIASGDLSSSAHCPFLLGNPQDIDGRIGEILFRHAGFEPKAAARSDNILTLLELCHYGMGACLCPERFLPALLGAERLRTLRVLDCGPETEYAIRFGVSATPYRWSVIDDFIRCAREVTTGVSQ